MISPNEGVYQVIGVNTPNFATRLTPIPDIIKVNPNIQVQPHCSNIKLQSKLPPLLMGPAHMIGRTNVEYHVPVPYVPQPIRRGVPKWGI